MAKTFRRERFSVFKNKNSAKKAQWFENMVRAKLDGDIVLMDGIFHLDGKEVFRAEEGTTRTWQMWHQFYMALDESKLSVDTTVAINNRSKKDWGDGKSDWKSSSRRKSGPSCYTAGLRREQVARDKAEKGIKS